MTRMNPEEILPPANDPRDSRKSSPIARMAAHLKAGGKVSPITAFKKPDAKLEVLAGETRRLAALQAGVQIEVIVRDTPLSEADILLERLRENEWREDLNDIELARNYVALMRLNQWSQTELAESIGKAPATINRALKVSKKLVPSLQDKVAAAELCPSAAYHLARLPADQQLALGERIIKERWKRERVEKEVKKLLGKRTRKPKSTKFTTPGVIVLIVPADTDYDEVLEELKNAMSRVRKGKRIDDADDDCAPVILPPKGPLPSLPPRQPTPPV